MSDEPADGRVLTLVVPAALDGFAYLRYRDVADVIGAAIVGLIMIGVTAASVLIRRIPT